MNKPGQLQAISIYTLIMGIINIVFGILWCLSIIGIIPGIYSIVTGILEIIYASKILPTPIKIGQPAKYVAIMEIVNIISFNVLSLAAGILSLVFYNDNQVRAYFNGFTQYYPPSQPVYPPSQPIAPPAPTSPSLNPQNFEDNSFKPGEQ